MRKGLMLASAWLCLLAAGCGSDVREGLVSDTVNLLLQTTTKVASIREGIESAEKKSDKVLNLQDAMRAADELKVKGRELQKTALMLRGIKDPVTDEEKKQYLKDFQGRIQDGMVKLNEETLKLNKKLRELEISVKTAGSPFNDPTSQAAVEELGKKIKDAQGEFDSLARQQ